MIAAPAADGSSGDDAGGSASVADRGSDSAWDAAAGETAEGVTYITGVTSAAVLPHAVIIPPPGASSPSGGRLTPLGRLLASLPVDVRVGKMLVYAAMLGCLDPVGVNKLGHAVPFVRCSTARVWSGVYSDATIPALSTLQGHAAQKAL